MRNSTQTENPLSLYRYIHPNLIFSLGLFLSACMGGIVWQWERQRLQSDLQDRADVLEETLQDILNGDSEASPTTQNYSQERIREELTRGESKSIRSLIETARSGLSLEDLNIYIWEGQLNQSERPLVLYKFNRHEFVTDLENNPPQLTGRGWLCSEFVPPSRSSTGMAFRQLRQTRSTVRSCRRSLQIGSDRLSFLLLPTPEYLAPYRYWRTWGTVAGGLLVTGFLAFYLQLIQRYTRQMEHLVRERGEKAEALQKALEELQDTQAMLVHSEKMSSLGQMVAGIAHEVNNPLQFVSGNVTHLNEYTEGITQLLKLYQQHYPQTPTEIDEYAEDIDIEFVTEDLPNILGSMQVGIDRIVQIVRSMRNFARTDQKQMKPTDLQEGIESTLLILHNRLKASGDRPGIEVTKAYQDIPLVECHGGQINQVFMNILANAIDALHDRDARRSPEEIAEKASQIIIRTELLEGDRVRVQIADNGWGIPLEAQQHIFEPFFTTKPEGKGTGLGMSISYKIVVENHGGHLGFESSRDRGTEFTIELPLESAELELSSLTGQKNPVALNSVR